MKYMLKFSFKPILFWVAFSASALCGPLTGVMFADGEDAIDEVLSGSSAPCVSRLPAYELSVGEGTYGRFAAKKSMIDCRGEFSKAVRKFSDEEKDMLTEYVVLIDSTIDAMFPILNGFQWKFAVISDTSNFGVPHSDKYIVLTKDLLKDMREWLDKQSSMLFVGMEILIHEKILLLQRAYPEPFEKFYNDVWEFRKIDMLPVDRIMRDNGLYFTRVPPNEWVIKVAPKGREYIMPALLLRDVGGEGGAVRRVAVAIDSTSKGFFPRKGKKMIIDYRDLHQILQYRKKFPLAEYDYHPSELSADLLAKFLIMNYVSGINGTQPAKATHYSQIDVLMKYVGGVKKQ